MWLPWYPSLVLLALSVPASNERGPLYTEQALAALHQANPHRLPLTFLLGRHREQTVLFCRLPPELRPIVEAQLYAQYPDARIEEVPEATLTPPAHAVRRTAALTLSPDIFPLKRFAQFDDPQNRTVADPLAALLTTLAHSQRDGLHRTVALTVQPAGPRHRHRVHAILARLDTPFFRRHARLAHWYVTAARSAQFPTRLVSWCVGRFGKPPPGSHPSAALHTSASRLHEREMDVQAGSVKGASLLFEARLLLTVAGPADQPDAVAAGLRELAGVFGVFSGLAAFHVTRPGPMRWHSPPRFLLSTEELATLWHAPVATVKAPTLTTVLSRELEPPVSLPTPRTHPQLAMLGLSSFRGQRQRFGILPDDRRRHVLIEGKTGMGKTTLLHHLLTADLRSGQGLGLIDPHGDLADAVLHQVPSARTNDIVLFDVGDTAYPLAFNVLACPNPAQRPLVASGVLSAFKKLYGDSWGPRLEHILRNALLTLLEVPGTSLVSVLRILSDAGYRRSILTRVSDPVLRTFWEHEFASLPPKLQAEAIAPIQNKVGAYVSSPFLRNILGQARGTLDLRRVMDEGRVLIVNLSKGRIGDDASMLLGSLLVTSLQLAAMSRADQPEEERRDFALYVDEFQNFATDSFATILSEARKYRLSLTLANQYLAQMDDATQAAVFGNIGTAIVFQVGANDSEILAQQLGGDVQEEDLLQLPRYQALIRLLIDGQPSRPFTMQTLPPRPASDDTHRSFLVRRASRHRYARPRGKVEEEIRAMFASA